MGSLCFYGLGLSRETGAIDRAGYASSVIIHVQAQEGMHLHCHALDYQCLAVYNLFFHDCYTWHMSSDSGLSTFAKESIAHILTLPLDWV